MPADGPARHIFGSEPTSYLLSCLSLSPSRDLFADKLRVLRVSCGVPVIGSVDGRGFS